MRAVIYRLWPTEDRDWYESALQFLHFAHEAGLHEDRWWPLLRERFGNVFNA